MSAEPLARQQRGGLTESLHLGHVIVLDRDGRERFRRGDPDAAVFARSSVKPIQALPLVLSGLALPDEVLAVAMASHSGQDLHRAAVQRLLDAAGLDAGLLQCGTHAPYHEPTARALDGPPDLLHCNCSGKHAGMLAVCRQQGWDLATYREADHPLQRWIKDLLARLSGAAEIGQAVDGCGVPVWHLPLRGLALAAARFASPTAADGELQAPMARLAAVWASHPRLIAGDGRLDTDLLAAGQGTLCAKIGGEAVHLGGWRGSGLGWAVKIADGNKRALGPVLARAAELAGRPLPHLAAHMAPEVRNNRGEVVGSIEAVF